MTTSTSTGAQQPDTRQPGREAPKATAESGDPAMHAELAPEVSTLSILGRLTGYMWRVSPGQMVVAIFARILTVGGALLSPYFLGQAINVLNEGGSTDDLWHNVMWSAVWALFAVVLGIIADLRLASLATAGLKGLQKDMFDTMQSLSLDFFDQNPVGELVSRVSNDSEQVARFYEDVVAKAIRSAIYIVAIPIVMFMVSWQLAVAALLVVPLMLGSTLLINKLSGPAFAQLAERLGELTAFQEESISGSKALITTRRREWAAAVHQEEAEKVFDISTKAWFGSVLQIPLSYVFTVIMVVVTAFVGGLLVVAGDIELGVVVAFMSYVALLATPITDIAQQTAMALSAAASGGRVFEIIDSRPTVQDAPDAEDLQITDGHVVFDDVDFSYIPGRKILRNNTFEALPGQKIGLVGPTGAGKSTIINMLTRYYDIDSGSITIDGQDLRSVSQESLRRQIGVVLQEAFLFSDTVMNNLKFASPEATDEDCIDAAKRANAHEFIERLPQGYDTMLTERGANLSQGQRQMLTIARAMVADPKILVLDEATSNVDTRTERMIQEGLGRLMEGRTSFVIAHRLSTIQDSHKILVLNGGVIAEQGTHEELLAARGLYHALYWSQFKGKGSDDSEVDPGSFVST